LGRKAPDIKNGTVSVLVPKDGGIFVGLSKGSARGTGLGSKRSSEVSQELVENARDLVARGCSGHSGACAELHAISRAMKRGVDLNGAGISTSVVRHNSKKVGEIFDACGTCREILSGKGINF
jgi:hypothetical protein